MFQEDWKNYLVILGLLAFSCICFLLITWGDEEEVPVKDIENTFELEKLPQYVSESKLDDITIKAFLHELMGDDYSFLIELFQKDMLNQNTDTMNELELEQYAKEVGRTIKQNKELVNAQVLSLDEIETVKNYRIELEFRDGKKKIIHVSTSNGFIITPLQELLVN